MTTVEISTDKARLNAAMIHAFLATESYWVPGISRTDVDKCIEHSLCFGLYLDGQQAGFARVVTDFVRFAHLLDVFILKEFRGLGYSKLLVGHILGHPQLTTVVRFSLGTADAHGLYRQFGFGSPASPERAMELTRPRMPTALQTGADHGCDIVSAGK
jgi:GNAT superfamily N-acetyltransferase